MRKIEGGKRVTIIFTDQQRALLAQKSELTGVPITVLVRRAIDVSLGIRQAPRPDGDFEVPVAQFDHLIRRRRKTPVTVMPPAVAQELLTVHKDLAPASEPVAPETADDK